MARKSRHTEVVEDINLVPIMNLVLCLIPLVLFKTQLVKIGMVNVSAPKIGPSSSTPPKDDDEKPLGLTVALGKDGFQLKATGANVQELLGLEGDGDNVGVSVKKKKEKYTDKKGNEVEVETYDFVQLYRYLEKLKDAYPDEKLLTLTADPTLEFKHLIRTMDVVRFRFKEAKGFESIQDLSKAAEKYQYESEEKEVVGDDGKKTKVTSYTGLWDQVTFAIAE